MLLAVGLAPATGKQLLLINDQIDLPKPGEMAGILTEADQEPAGLVTHEMGHVLANQAGITNKSFANYWLRAFGIGPTQLDEIGWRAASDPEEAIAELHAQQFTAGHQIKDPDLRMRVVRMFTEMEDAVRAAHEESSIQPIVALSPAILAEAERAARKNIAAGDWVAQTPELDRLRKALGEESK
jgi:hypothetical protein